MLPQIIVIRTSSKWALMERGTQAILAGAVESSVHDARRLTLLRAAAGAARLALRLDAGLSFVTDFVGFVALASFAPAPFFAETAVSANSHSAPFRTGAFRLLSHSAESSSPPISASVRCVRTE